MAKVINLDKHRLGGDTASLSECENKTPSDLSAAVSLERVMEQLTDSQSWMEAANTVPPDLSTGDPVHDAQGLALALNHAGRETNDTIEVFKLTMGFFNKLLQPLNEDQREAVLSTLDQNTARALLMLDYSEKLKAAELAPMVDAALRARG